MPVIAVLLAVWLLSLRVDMSCLMVSDGSPWWTLFTYIVVHTGIVHLGINSFVFWTYYRIMSVRDMAVAAPLSLVVSAFAAYVSCTDIPTCGFSSVVASVMGYSVSGLPVYRMVRPLAVVTVSFVFTYLFGKGINTQIHVFSFFPSLAAGMAIRRWLPCLLRKS